MVTILLLVVAITARMLEPYLPGNRPSPDDDRLG